MREARGLSQEALAHAVGLHVTWISELERGRRNPTLANIKKIAAGLEVRLVELVALTEEMDAKD